MELKLFGKVALVTGSYRGTGLIIAKTLIDEGVEVFIHGLDVDQANSAVSKLGAGIPVSGNIDSPEGCSELLTQCSNRGISILINNYGGADPGSWESSSSQDWLEAYEKNVLSAQRITQGLLPELLSQAEGRIINIGTIGTSRPNSIMPAYYSAKGALATMTMSLAKKMSGTGVRVNLVSPGMILTDEVKESLLRKAKKAGESEDWETVESAAAKHLPTRKIATREEVAALVTFLCSDYSRSIHGQNIKVDGGQLEVLM
tara:strand:+ start:575 stop:1351 length:777 start_codon:yes stop_codon:yes gene_type:complete